MKNSMRSTKTKGPPQTSRPNLSLEEIEWMNAPMGPRPTAVTVPKKHSNRSIQRRMEAAVDSRIRHFEKCRGLFGFMDRDVYAAGKALLRSDAALAEWMCAPAQALGGKTPIRAIRTASGRKRVVRILLALEYGVYL